MANLGLCLIEHGLDGHVGEPGLVKVLVERRRQELALHVVIERSHLLAEPAGTCCTCCRVQALGFSIFLQAATCPWCDVSENTSDIIGKVTHRPCKP